VTIAGNQGQNVYPNPDNYPVSSFPQPVPAPTVEADDAGTFMYVGYSWEWQQVLLAAVDQLKNPATWQGDHDAIIQAIDRATDLQYLLQAPIELSTEVETPFWDDEENVDDNAPADDQRWYGEVTNPTAPADELDFVESVLLWGFTGLIALATFEVGGFAPAILFHTTVKKFIITQKRGDVAETIRFVVDGEDAKFVNTAPYSEGDLIETTIITPDTDGDHTLMIVYQPS